MKKLNVKAWRGALPKPSTMVMFLAGVLVVGLLANGPGLGLLLWLGIAVFLLVMKTIANYDPMAWEAHYDPLTHALRLERDQAVELLTAIVDTEFNDPVAYRQEIKKAEDFLHELTRTTEK